MEDAGRGDDAGEPPERRRPRAATAAATASSSATSHGYARSRAARGARSARRSPSASASCAVDDRDRAAARRDLERGRAADPAAAAGDEHGRVRRGRALMEADAYPGVTVADQVGATRRCTHDGLGERDARGRRQGRHRHRVGPGRRQGHGAAPRQGRRAGRRRGVEGRAARRRDVRGARRARRRRTSASCATSRSATRSTRWSRRRSSGSAASTGSINNAQTFRPLAPIADGERGRRRRVLRLRREGHAVGDAGRVPAHARRRAGVASSTSRRRWASPAARGFAAYNASKEAIRALTRTAAREWAPDGIVVNAIAPAAADASRRGRASRARATGSSSRTAR